MAQKVYLKKSSVQDKVPSAGSLNFGELAINYASGTGKSFLATKKYDGTMATFHEDTYNDATFATKGEVSSMASDISGLQGDVTTIKNNYVTKNDLAAASAATFNSAYTAAMNYVDAAMSGVTDANFLTVDSATTVFSNYDNQISTIQSDYALSSVVNTRLTELEQTVEDDEYVIAQALNDLNGRLGNVENMASSLTEEFLTIDSATSIVSNLENSIQTAENKADSAYNYTNIVSGSVTKGYYTSAQTQAKINEAKNAAVTSAFNASVASANAYTDGKISPLESSVQDAITSARGAYSYAEGVSATVKTGYWNSATTASKIGEAKNAAVTSAFNASVTSANSYTDSKISEINSDVQGAVAAANSAFNYTQAVSATVKNSYYTSGQTRDQIAAASARTFASAKTYADATFVTKDTYNTYTGGVASDLAILAKSAATVSANVISLSANVVSKLSSVYKYKGTKTNYSQLPPTGNESGDVWNVANPNGNTPSGTNYAWVVDNESTGTGHWDALGGSIDLSAYALSSTVSGLESRVSNLETGLSATVVSTYATKSFVGAASGYAYNQAKTDLIGPSNAASSTDTIRGAKKYTDEKIKSLSGDMITYVNGKETTLNSEINNLKTGLSAWTYNNAATHTEVANASAHAITSAVTSAYNASVAYVNNALQGINSGTFLTVASATSIVNDINSQIDELNDRIGGFALSGTVDAMDAEIRQIITDDEEITAAALTDLDRRIKNLSGGVSANFATIQSVESVASTAEQALTKAQSAYTYANNINTNLTNNYYKKTDTNTQIANASARTVMSAKTYADATFLTKASAGTMYAAVSNEVNAASTLAQSAYTYAGNINTNLTNNYYKKTDTNTQIANASARTFASAKTYADATFLTKASAGTMYAAVSNEANAASTLAQSAYTYANNINTNLTNNYYKKTDTNTQIGNASARTFASAKTYADATFLTKASAGTMYNAVSSDVNILKSSAATLNNKFANYMLTSDIQKTYWNSGTTSSKIGAASGYAYNQATAYTKTLSGNVVTAINGVTSKVNTVETNLNALSASVMSDYATETEASSYAAAALGNAMAYTDSKISGLSIGNYLTVASANSIVTSLNNSIQTAQNKADSAYNRDNATSATVKSGYYTSGQTRDQIAAASARTFASAKTYADATFVTKSTYNTYTGGVASDLSTLAKSAATVSGNVIALSAAIVSRITTVMRYKGSVANCSNLPANAETGDTYNVQNASGTTPAGTNWTWDGSKWDPLGGTIDLSGYLTKSSAATLFNGVTSTINSVSGGLVSLSASVVNNYATDAKASSYAAAALSNAMDYTDSRMGSYLTLDSATTKFSNLDSSIATHTNQINGLTTNSGKLNTTLTKVNSSYVSAVSFTTGATAASIANNTLTIPKPKVLTIQENGSNVTTYDGMTSVTAATYDKKVGQSSVTTAQRRAILLGTTTAATGSALSTAAVTGETTFNANIYARPDTGKIYSAGFALTGGGTNLLTADGGSVAQSTFATAGHDHNSAYVSNVSISGNNVRVTKNGANTDLTVPYATIAKDVSAATFGWSSYGEHNANNIKTNGMWYYSSNGPTTGIGASTGDGALYSQAYSTSWVGQIAQDYRNGRLFIRGLNNGTWTSWLKVWDSGNFDPSGYVPTTRKVNGHALSADVTVTLTDLGIGNVENTKLSTWTGNTSIKSVGTITAGTWNGTNIALNKLASSAITIDGTSTALGGSVTTKNVLQTNNTEAKRRPLLLGVSSAATGTALATTTQTGQSFFNTSIYAIPSTGKLYAGGYALTGGGTNLLTADGGSVAQSTFAKPADVTKVLTIQENGTNLTTYNGTTAVTAATNDKKVQQENSTGTTYRPLLMGSNNNAAQASIPTTTVTATSYFNKDIYAQPSTGELGATQMKVGGHVTLQYNSATEALDFIFS